MYLNFLVKHVSFIKPTVETPPIPVINISKLVNVTTVSKNVIKIAGKNLRGESILIQKQDFQYGKCLLQKIIKQ